MKVVKEEINTVSKLTSKKSGLNKNDIKELNKSIKNIKAITDKIKT